MSKFIQCANCEAHFPVEAKDKGDWIAPFNAQSVEFEEFEAQWICGFCARSIDRWRASEDYEEIEAELDTPSRPSYLRPVSPFKPKEDKP